MRTPTLVSLMALATAVSGQYLSDYVYVSDREQIPTGSGISFGGQDTLMGPMHTNGQISAVAGTTPLFQGWVTTRGCDINGVVESQYPYVFPEGLLLGYDRMVFPEVEEIQQHRELVLPEHSYPACDADSLQLTTLIRFDYDVYHVCQYVGSLVEETDTSYTLPWQTRTLPETPPLIWVDGVTRVQGIVAGQITLVSADSLFLTGDVITADTILEPCDSDSLFGTVPPGSPHRIGLIGLGDVIIAATPANGLGNGQENIEWNCPTPYPPVIDFCGQARKDIVLTASILALGCSFGSEYWKTSAQLVSQPAPEPQLYCGGSSNTHIESVVCNGSTGLQDVRGRIWLHGSMANRLRNYVQVGPPGLWGMNTIGYRAKLYRHDANLLDSTPPFWPGYIWVDDDPPGVSLNETGLAWCGTVADPQQFRLDWESGSIRLQLGPSDFLHCNEEQLRMGVFLDGVEAAHADTVLRENMNQLQVIPEFGLPMEGFHTVHLEVSWDHQRWNEGGEECRWELQFTDVADRPRTRPHTLGLTAYPNPFNPGTTVTFETESAGPAQLVVYDVVGRRVRTLIQEAAAAGVHHIRWDGNTATGESAPSGVYFLDLIGPGGTRETAKVLLVR